MPIHDWTCVDAGIFHHFNQSWIGTIARTLNDHLLPNDYYALKEQFAAGLGPDDLTLQGAGNGDEHRPNDPADGDSGGVSLAVPKLQPVAETDLAFYRRKQTAVAIRHVSADRVVAIVEIVSSGNKAAQHPFRAFVQKAADFIEAGIHLLLIDIYPPGRRDPQGIHAVIWEVIAGESYSLPKATSLTLAAYECGDRVRAYVLHPAIGDPLPEMPLFLEPGQAVTVPLESTYEAAFNELPRRWQRVLVT